VTIVIVIVIALPFHSLCDSEVSLKIITMKSRRHVPECLIAGDA